MKKFSIGIAIVVVLSMVLSLMTPVFADDDIQPDEFAVDGAPGIVGISAEIDADGDEDGAEAEDADDADDADEEEAGEAAEEEDEDETEAEDAAEEEEEEEEEAEEEADDYVIAIPVVGFDLADCAIPADFGENFTGWCTDGNDGYETSLTLGTLAAAKYLVVEFSAPIDGAMTFITQSAGNGWWQQTEGIEVYGTVLVVDLAASEDWAGTIKGPDVKFFIGDWGTNYWEDAEILSAGFAFKPAELVIGEGVSVVSAVYFDDDTWLELSNGGQPTGAYTSRPEMEAQIGPQTGGENIGWIDTGEYVNYTVTIEQSGEYLFFVRASSGGGGGSIDFFLDDEWFKTVDVPDTGGWGNFRIFEAGTVELEAGVSVIRVEFTAAFDFSAMIFAEPYTTNPYKDHIIYGSTTIDAADFDNDDFFEITVDYHNTFNSSWFSADSSLGLDNAYTHRPEFHENHDGPQTENNDVPGLGNIGAVCWTIGEWLDEDDELVAEAEWVQYTINVAKAGKYALSAWASSGDGAVTPLEVSMNGEVVGAPEIANTGWGGYELYDVAVLDLPLGTHIFRVAFPAGGINFAAFVFNEGTEFALPPPPPPPPAPAPVTPPAAPSPVTPEGGGEAPVVTPDEAADVGGNKENPQSGDSAVFFIVFATLAGAALVTVKKIRVR